MRDMHDRGLALGDIGVTDIFISDNLWIQVIYLSEYYLFSFKYYPFVASRFTVV